MHIGLSPPSIYKPASISLLRRESSGEKVRKEDGRRWTQYDIRQWLGDVCELIDDDNRCVSGHAKDNGGP